MGKELAGHYPVARRTFEEADEALGYKLSELCFEGPEEKLRLTEITQPAILTASVAVWRVLQERGLHPDLVAGHSLGEYSAHVAAGTLTFADAVRTVRNRGKYMQEAVPVGVGAMAAILGMTLDQVERNCERSGAGRSLPGGQYQFTRANRDLGTRRRRGPRHEAGHRTRGEEGRKPAGERAFPLFADATGAGSPGARPEGAEFSGSVVSGGLRMSMRRWSIPRTLRATP